MNVRHVPLVLASVAAKDSATLHIYTNQSINTRKHSTLTPLGKVYIGVLVVTSSTPHQRAFVCGACTIVILFVTCKSMMTVSTRRMCIPPRYTTIPVLFYACAVPDFPKTWCWCVSTSPESGTVNLPIESRCPCVLINLYITMMINLAGFSKYSAPTHLLPVLSCVSLLCVCGLGLCPVSGLVCDLLSKNRKGLSPKAHCQTSISFHKRDRHCLEDTKVTWCLSYPNGETPLHRRYISW